MATMTAEHVLVIDPSDLRAIRLECMTCHATLSFQLDQTISIPQVCVACNQPWIDMSHLKGQPAAGALANALKAWLQTERAEKPSFRFRFELANPKG